MKLKSRIFLASSFFALAAGLFLIGSSPVLGQGFAYTPLEQIPGAAGANTLPEYIEGIYKFGIWTVGIAALFMLSVGGFVYMTSGGNTATLSRAKGYIADALIGLVLALLAYLILYVINPDLVNLNLSKFGEVGGVVPPVTKNVVEKGSSGGVCYDPKTPIPKPAYVPHGNAAATALAKKLLNDGFIKIVGTGDCKSARGNVTRPTGVTYSTVSTNATVSPLSTLYEAAWGNQMTTCFKDCDSQACGTLECSGNSVPSQTMLSALDTVSHLHPGKITIQSITGGSHAAGSIHYTGKAVDITVAGVTWGAALKSFIDAGAQYDGTKAKSFCEASNGALVKCLAPDNINSGINHLHLVFP